MKRVLVIALVGCGAVVLAVAAGVGWYALEPPAPHPEIRPAPIGPFDWTETKRTSVSRVLIVEGECPDRERAREIAEWIVERSSEGYDEVLVYVRAPDGVATRRVQWTREAGYRLLDY